VSTNNNESKFPGPMSESLKNISCLTKDRPSLQDLEKMSRPFSNIDSQTVESTNLLSRNAAAKTSFNYLLIDPRVVRDQQVWQTLTDQELWRIFISSVFYIGKGTRSRPLKHLYEAKEAFKKAEVKGKVDEKINTVHGIWEAGKGVINLQVFQNTIGVEGFTREAAMIKAMGCNNLSNAKPGSWYGPAADWNEDQQTRLGTFLLHRTFKIFLEEGAWERQIRHVDLKRAGQK